MEPPSPPGVQPTAHGSGWYELTQRQAREGLAHTTFVACARVDGVCVAMGRILFDYGYTAYLGDVAVLPAGRAGGLAGRSWSSCASGSWTPPAGGDHYVFLGAAKGKEPFYEKLGFETSPSDTAGSGMRKTVTKA